MSAPTPKTPHELTKMRIAGRLAAEVLDMIGPFVKAGVRTDELDKICHDYIVNVQKAIPAPLNYRGFPKSICTSLNQVVCHGIPGERILKNGDILNIDVTVIKDGYHGDTSKMYFVGEPSIMASRLVRVTQECLYLGIAEVKAGNNIARIGQAIQSHAHKERFSVVEDYCGHGIGSIFHEKGFSILHYDCRDPKYDMIMEEGMTFTIEPMINQGAKQTKLMPDGWTAVTKDRGLSAQWEHTLAVTKDGVEVLTLREEEKNMLSKYIRLP